MDKNILYITFVDFKDQKSGSSVRPKKIYDAFVEEGYKISLLTGLQNRKMERWKNVWKYFKEIRKNDYEFCYVEPPAGPMFNLCDHLMLFYISKIKKVNVGLFYRDAYWKFANWYDVKGLKKMVINTMHRFDLFVIKNTCKKMYFPTNMMGDLFDFKDKEPLPPGCEIVDITRNEIDSVEIIYVGGLSEQYGGKLLLESLDKVNNDRKMNLHVVCREDDKKYLEGYENKDWIHLYHVSGDELLEVYKKANVAIIPRKVDFYMDFAMPVKLFEYISYGLPIITTKCKEVAKFVSENNIGVVCDDNVDSLYKSLINMKLSDIDEYSKNVQITRKNNTWLKRVEQIANLGGKL